MRKVVERISSQTSFENGSMKDSRLLVYSGSLMIRPRPRSMYGLVKEMAVNLAELIVKPETAISAT